MILPQGRGILLVDREVLVVEGAWDAVWPRIEDGNGRKCRHRDAVIHGGNATLIIAPEESYTQVQRARRSDLRADVEFVGVRPRKRRQNG